MHTIDREIRVQRENDTAAGELRHADERQRRDWIEQFPDYELPEHEDPPYDRDRTLPVPDGWLGEPWEPEDEEA